MGQAGGGIEGTGEGSQVITGLRAVILDELPRQESSVGL